jgi:hypothetical protein
MGEHVRLWGPVLFEGRVWSLKNSWGGTLIVQFMRVSYVYSCKLRSVS